MASPSKQVNFVCENLASKNENSRITTPECYLSESSSGFQWIKNKLIVTYIPQNMDKADILPMFQAIGEVAEFKLIKRNRSALENVGFGFVTYIKDEDAEEAIRRIDGVRVFNKTLKVSYARPNSKDIKDTNLFVSGFSKLLTEEQLKNIFKPFGTIISTHILHDNTTIRQYVKDGEKLPGISKGVGFIRYNTRQEAETAVRFLDGAYLENSREPLMIKYARNDFATNISQDSRTPQQIHQTRFNTMKDFYYLHDINEGYCLFVYNLPREMTDKFLWNMFAKFGRINYAKIAKDSETERSLRYGFVTFMYYKNAIAAIKRLNGYQLKGHILQVRFKNKP